MHLAAFQTWCAYTTRAGKVGQECIVEVDLDACAAEKINPEHRAAQILLERLGGSIETQKTGLFVRETTFRMRWADPELQAEADLMPFFVDPARCKALGRSLEHQAVILALEAVGWGVDPVGVDPGEKRMTSR